MNDNNDIGAKDHLLRDSLIATAVAFLRNEKVKSSPIEKKIEFLKNKGLSKEEIDEALSQSELDSSFTLMPDRRLVLSESRSSFWSTLRHSILSFMFFTGSAYVLLEVFQRYISPYLFKSSKKDEDILEKLLETNVELNNNMISMVTTLNDLRRQVTKNNEQLGNMKHLAESLMATTEMKEEMKSLKALFLSKSQFPPPPPANPIIPSWQLERKGKNELNLVQNKTKNSSCDDGDDVIGNNVNNSKENINYVISDVTADVNYTQIINHANDV